MTKEEFIRKWKIPLAGLALYGVATEATGTPLVRANHALGIPSQVERFLERMWLDVAPSLLPESKDF